MVFEQHTAHEAESKERRANALGLISCRVLAVEGPASVVVTASSTLAFAVTHIYVHWLKLSHFALPLSSYHTASRPRDRP